MLHIFDRNNQKLIGLADYWDYHIKTTLGLSDKTLYFKTYHKYISSIELEGFVETKTDRFVIKEVNPSSDGTITVVCPLEIDDLEGKAIQDFYTQRSTIKSAIQSALNGTTWTVGDCSITKERTLSLQNTNVIGVLEQAISTYRVEIKLDSKAKKVHVYEKMGSDKGAYFHSDLNLDKLSIQNDTYDFYTELEAYGAEDEETGELITFASINNGKNYVENHTYSQKKKRIIWKDERYTVKEHLLEDATAKLADYATPFVSYSAEVRDLAAISDKYSILEYSIGDTITLVDPVTGIKEKQRISEIDHYPEEPWNDTCVLANLNLTFEQQASRFEQAVDTVDNITNESGGIDGSTVDSIKSSQVSDLGDAVMTTLQAHDIHADRIQATELYVGLLVGNEGHFEDLTADEFRAMHAKIDSLDAQEINATVGKFKVLDADYANLKHVLAGNAAATQADVIQLNSNNASIDSALIRSIISQNITVNDLMAGTIYTNKQKIMSQDGSLSIEGATMLFKDNNNKPRIQIGKDGQGNFTFVLYSADGVGQLINENGIQASAIADGLIVDDMVSDGANIQASKLDIASLFSVINENGENVIKANRIYFDEEGQTLTQQYTQMIDSIRSGYETNFIAYPYRDKDNTTNNGITYTVNEDKSVTANGTTESSNSFYHFSHNNKRIIVEPGTYTFTGCPKGGSTTTYCVYVQYFNANNVAVTIGVDTGDGLTFTVDENKTNLKIYIRIYNGGVTVENLVFKPMLVKGSIGHEYVPYTDGVSSIKTRVGTVETGVEGLRVNLGSVETTINGITSKSLVHNWTYTVTNGVAVCDVHIYKAGSTEDKRSDFPASCFTWYKQTDDGLVKVGTGYTVRINQNEMGFGGDIMNEFIYDEE